MESVNVFDALGDAHRRQMMERLGQGSGLSVSELARGIGISRQATDKHLKILMAADLIVARRHGRERVHYVNPLTVRKAAMGWLKRFDDVHLIDLAPE